MRRLMIVLLTVGLATPVAGAQFSKVKGLFTKDKTYTLGANVTSGHWPGSYHELREDLGWFQVLSYEKHLSLTLRFLPEKQEVLFSRDPDVDDAIDCDPEGDVLLHPGQVCALMARDDEREREYHFQVSWTLDEDDDIWVVKVYVKMQVVKLD